MQLRKLACSLLKLACSYISLHAVPSLSEQLTRILQCLLPDDQSYGYPITKIWIANVLFKFDETQSTHPAASPLSSS